MLCLGVTEVVVREIESGLILFHDHRPGEEIHQLFDHTNRPGTRSTTAMRGGEGLVQVVVHDIDAKLTGLGYPQQGVHIRAIAIHQTTGLMHDGGDIAYILIEQTQGVWVGEHETSEGLVTFCLQGFQIDIAALIRGNLLDDKAAHCRGGRVGTMGGVGDKDLVAFSVSVDLMILLDDQIPVSSPCAPAAGCRVVPANPPISERNSCS